MVASGKEFSGQKHSYFKVLALRTPWLVGETEVFKMGRGESGKRVFWESKLADQQPSDPQRTFQPLDSMGHHANPMGNRWEVSIRNTAWTIARDYYGLLALCQALVSAAQAWNFSSRFLQPRQLVFLFVMQVPDLKLWLLRQGPDLSFDCHFKETSTSKVALSNKHIASHRMREKPAANPQALLV